SPYPGMPGRGLDRTEEIKLLDKLIAHPDSFAYDLIVYNESIDYYIKLRPGVFSKVDSNSANIYFAVYHPEVPRNSRFRPDSDTTFMPLSYTSSVSVPRSGTISGSQFKNMNFSSVRALLQRHEGINFYMAAKASEGITESVFRQACELVL